MKNSPKFTRCCEFVPGLSDGEIQLTHERFGFVFPPDVRQFLQSAMPVARSYPCTAIEDDIRFIRSHKHFPSWRNGSTQELSEWIDSPIEGILFDVERNNFWYPGFGQRPTNLAAALNIVREKIGKAPRLIPVYGHRFVPSTHVMYGPVVSISQTDIIIYGESFPKYILSEFSTGENNRTGDRCEELHRKCTIPFWSDFFDYIWSKT